MKNSIAVLFIFIAAQLTAGAFAVVLEIIKAEAQGGSPEAYANDLSAMSIMWGMLLADLIVFLLLRVLRLNRKNPFQQTQHLSSQQWLLGIAGMILLSAGISGLLQPFALDDDGAYKLFEQMSTHWAGFLCIAVVGPIVEELVFREGILRSLLNKGYAPWIALSISSLLFGIIHMNFFQMIPAVFMGFVLGWFYLRTGNLLLPAIAHIANNTFAFAELKIYGAEALNEPTSLWVALPLGALFTLMSLLCIRRLHGQFRAAEEKPTSLESQAD